MAATVVALFASFAAAPVSASETDVPEPEAEAAGAVDLCDAGSLMLGDPPEPTDGPPLRGASDLLVPGEPGGLGIYVEPGLLSSIQGSIDQYVDDLRLEGYEPFVQEFTGTAPALRAALQSEYADGLRGALFVGDLPTYEFTSGDPVTETYLHDLYFMDLDGTYIDSLPVDVHRDGTGDVEPEIYVSRITASTVVWLVGGGSEAAVINDYFGRVHDYRTGSALYAQSGAVFADADWANWEWANAMSALYGWADIDSVHELPDTTPAQYLSLIGTDHESWLQAVHSAPSSMSFYASPGYVGYEGALHSWDVVNAPPAPGFYNLFSCSAGDYTAYDFLLGATVIASDRGLHGISSTKPGGIAMYDNYGYYAPLGRGATVGQAFHEFFQTHTGSTDVPGEAGLIAWLNGMVMQGDPTLVPETMGDGPASISGMTWDDVDGDGARDATEPGLPGWTIFLDQNGNGVLDPWERSEVTDAAGEYEFTNLSPARYLVTEVVPSDWVQTSPAHIVDYTAVDSTEPGGPTYDWIDISATGIPVFLEDDDVEEVPLLAVPFYDEDTTTVGISSNGFLLMDEMDGGWVYVNEPIPTADAPNGIVAGFWDDLYPPGGGTIYHGYEPNTSRFVVQYDEVPYIGMLETATFEIILEPDGTILVQYEDMSGFAGSGTVGIENLDGTGGVQRSFNDGYVTDGLAVRFDPVFANVRTRVVDLRSGESAIGVDLGNLDVPGAVVDLTASASDSTVTARWDPPAGAGGAVVDGYRVELDPGGVVQNVTGTSASFAGLDPDDYTVTVQATNVVGAGPAVVSPVVSVIDVPSAPRNLTVTASGGTLTATWDPPVSDGNSAIVGYRVELDPGDVVQDVTGTGATFTGLAADAYTVSVRATNAAGNGPEVIESAVQILGDRVGYMMLRADGVIHGFGDATVLGNVASVDDAVKIVSNADGSGYWVLDEGGRVHAFGVSHFGDLASTSRAGWLPGEQPAALSVMPDELGYWIFTDRGRAFEFGSAADYGDLVELGLAPILNGPVVDSVATPDGLGYYMVAADGGVFSFGSAEFHGSMGGIQLNQPVNALVPDPDNVGYWLIALDGGVFAFDAPFVGSVPGELAPGVSLNAPVIGGLAYGNGYLMVATDGGIFSFSDLPFLGSLGSNPPPSAVVSVAAFAT